MDPSRPATYLRRIDDQLVEALQYTGSNLDRLRAWLGAGYRVDADGDGVVLTREHPPQRIELGAWDWVVNDGLRVYAVRSYDFWTHVRSVPVE